MTTYYLVVNSNSRKRYRLFKDEESAYEYKFKVYYKSLRKKLVDNIDYWDKCQDPEYAKQCFESLLNPELRGLYVQGIEHLDRLLNSDLTWKQKYDNIFDCVIKWGNDYVSIVSILKMGEDPYLELEEITLEG
jgi:hypothetical protein